MVYICTTYDEIVKKRTPELIDFFKPNKHAKDDKIYTVAYVGPENPGELRELVIIKSDNEVYVFDYDNALELIEDNPKFKIGDHVEYYKNDGEINEEYKERIGKTAIVVEGNNCSETDTIVVVEWDDEYSFHGECVPTYLFSNNLRLVENKETKNKISVKIEMETPELDTIIYKVRELNALLKKTNKLIKELGGK